MWFTSSLIAVIASLATVKNETGDEKYDPA